MSVACGTSGTINRVEQADRIFGAVGSDPFSVGTDRHHRCRSAGGDVQLLHVLWPTPQLGFSKSARCQQVTVHVERQCLNQIPMRPAGSTCQGGVFQLGDQLSGRNMMQQDLVASSKGDVLTILRQRDSLNRSDALWQSSHLFWRHGFDSTCPARSLIDPEFDEPQFLWSQIFGGNVIAFGRHHGFDLMRGHLNEQTLRALSRDNSRTIVTAFEHRLRRLKDQFSLLLSGRVTRQTILLQDRQHVLIE